MWFVQVWCVRTRLSLSQVGRKECHRGIYYDLVFFIGVARWLALTVGPDMASLHHYATLTMRMGSADRFDMWTLDILEVADCDGDDTKR